MSLDLPSRPGLRITETGLARLVLMLFTWLILVGGTPLSGSFEADADDAQGFVRTFAFLAGFLVALALAVARGRLFRAVPLPLLFLILWCALTLSWAIDPQIALGRLGLGVVVTLTLFLSIDRIGVPQALRAVTLTVTIILWADLATSMFIDSARHMVGERDADLVGLWRGLHGHKNIAGSVAALGLMLALFQCRLRTWRFWLIMVPASLMLVGSGSRTAMAVLAATLVTTMLLKVVRWRRRERVLVAVLSLLALLMAALPALAHLDAVSAFLDDPHNLTGRTALWQILVNYWLSHPWGSGFESFWRIGAASPALAFSGTTGTFAAIAPHGHNGYLDMLASTGLVGLSLTLFATMVFPLWLFFRNRRLDSHFAALGLALVLFFIFHNGLESSVLKGARVGWFVFCLGLGILASRVPKP